MKSANQSQIYSYSCCVESFSIYSFYTHLVLLWVFVCIFSVCVYASRHARVCLSARICVVIILPFSSFFVSSIVFVFCFLAWFCSGSKHVTYLYIFIYFLFFLYANCWKWTHLSPIIRTVVVKWITRCSVSILLYY